MKRLLALIPLFIAFSVSAQVDSDFENGISHSVALLEQARNAENDSLRQALVTQFDNEFWNLLGKDETMSYPFDNIKPVSVLKSPDNKFRIFTWGLQFADGNYKYYGIVQINVQGDVVALRLNDMSDGTTNPSNANMQASNWYGAIYYDLVQLGGKKSNIYALIGWDGGDLFVNRKVLEQVRIATNNGGEIIFGGNFINEHNKKVDRLIFEFTERAVMSLRYDKKLKMFVADHLASPSEYKGNTKFMGPDGSFDGYKYDKGFWMYVPDLDIKATRF